MGLGFSTPLQADPEKFPDYGSTKGESDSGDSARDGTAVEGVVPGGEDEERGEGIVSQAGGAEDKDKDKEQGDEDSRGSRWRKALYRSRVLALLLTVGALTGAAMLLSALEEKGVIHWFGSWGLGPPVHAMTDLGPMIGTMAVRAASPSVLPWATEPHTESSPSSATHAPVDAS